MSIHVTVRVGVEWINNFHADACQQNSLSYCKAQAEGFYNHMGSHGHTRVFDWGNDNAWETDFRHPDFGGDSLNWSDDVHFCFYDDHGGNWGNVLHLCFAVAHAHCLSASTDWRLGTKMLKWFVVAGCDGVLNTSAAHVVAVWGGPMQGAHLAMGYIGTSSDSSWTSSLGEDFADDICGGDAIATSWCDRAYSFWVGDHSIAIAAGETQADAVNRREHETLDWRDLNVNFTAWLAWKWRD
jgi:hypothetical protein